MSTVNRSIARTIHGRTPGAIAVAMLALAMLAPADGQAQSHNRTVTVVLPEEPSSLDACSSTSSDIGRVIQDNVAEGLTQIDTTNSTIKPRLATSWQQVDDLTWQFKLRPGVTFHDGAPLNAAAAAHGLNRTLATQLKCNVRFEYFAQMKVTARAIDDLTLEVKTDTTQPILPAYLTWVMLVSPNTSMTENVQTSVGTGPYVIETYKPGVEITLKRNETWWGGKPQAEAVRYVWRKESSVQAAMVKVGEADLAPSIASQEADDPKTDVSFPNAETAYVRIDTGIAPLNDRRVRLALQLATNVESLRGSIFPKEVVPATNLVIANIAGHNPDLKRWPFDPEKARQLLKEAKADGVPVDREIKLYGRTNFYANNNEALEALMAMWTAVGFNIKLEVLEAARWRVFNFRGPAEREPVLLQGRHNNQGGDPIFSLPARLTCQGSASSHCNPALDPKIAAAERLPAGPERIKAWQEVARISYEDDIANLFLFHLVGYARINPRINYKPTLLTNNVIEISTITFK